MNEARETMFDLSGVEYLEEVLIEAQEVVYSDGLLVMYADEVAQAINDVLDSLRQRLPSSNEELMPICARINQALIPLLKAHSKLDSSKETKKAEGLRTRIRKLRVKARLIIRQQALESGGWDNVVITDNDSENATSTRETVLAYFGLSKEDLIKEAPRYEEARTFFETSAGVTYRKIVGIEKYYRSRKSNFETLWDLLADAIPEFADLFLARKTFSWRKSTPEQALSLRSRLRERFAKDFSIPDAAPEKQKELNAARSKITDLRSADLLAADFAYENGYGVNRPFSSLTEFLLFVFGEDYGLEEKDFERDTRTISGSAEFRAEECRRRILEGLGYTEETLPKKIGTKEWWQFVFDLSEVNTTELYVAPFSLNLIFSLEKEDPRDYVASQFADIGLKPAHLKPFARRLIKERSEEGLRAAPSKRDRVAISDIVKNGTTDLSYLLDELNMCPSRVDKEDFRAMVEEEFTARIKGFGYLVPVNLRAILKLTARSVVARINRDARD